MYTYNSLSGIKMFMLVWVIPFIFNISSYPLTYYVRSGYLYYKRHYNGYSDILEVLFRHRTLKIFMIIHLSLIITSIIVQSYTLYGVTSVLSGVYDLIIFCEHTGNHSYDNIANKKGGL